MEEKIDIVFHCAIFLFVFQNNRRELILFLYVITRIILVLIRNLNLDEYI